MPVFEKIMRLVQSNVDEMMDGLDDPQKVLDQLLVEMEDDLREVKMQVATAIREQNKLEVHRRENYQKSQHLEARAIVFVKQGDDSRARDALRRKRDLDKVVNDFERQLRVQRESVETLKNGLSALKSRIEEVKHRRTVLLARQRSATARKRINQILADTNRSQSQQTFSKIENKIFDQEVEISAHREVDYLLDPFATLPDERLEKELEDLKKKIKGE